MDYDRLFQLRWGWNHTARLRIPGLAMLNALLRDATVMLPISIESHVGVQAISESPFTVGFTGKM